MTPDYVYLLIEAVSYYLYALKWVTLVLASLMLVLGLDDLFIDFVYWGRTTWRNLGLFRRVERADESLLYSVPEKPLAIMVPAWREVGVVGAMAHLAASTLDYENYQIFVGTYPNDPETQADVDAVCMRYPNVHKVVCARPGPTSKADCLNNIIDAILRFESQAKLNFAGFILHDAEDVISPLELRLFNYLLPRKDLIQVPVYPYVKRWWNFTTGHYADEFAELHGKDVVVREALVGQVPSAGVGTCFSRRAVVALLEDGDGIAFDVQSLTEDYDIGFRLKNKGMTEIFARFSVRDERLSPLGERNIGVSKRAAGVICVREHFPETMETAIRQKARWITGIVYQGTRTLGWSSHPFLNYFLWRDRRGAISNAVGLLGSLVFLQLLLVWSVSLMLPDAWHFPSVLGDSAALQVLLVVNGVLLLNRLIQRCYFAGSFYGVMQGALAAPRMLWSNWVNFFANLRALKQVLAMGDSRRVAWDKTSHEFPALADSPRREPIGRRLLNAGAITAEQLEEALTSTRHRRIGRELLARGWINSLQLAQALAAQADLEWTPLNPFTIDAQLIEQLPARLALRYSVLPIAELDGTLVIASERELSQVSLGAMSRQLGRKIICKIAPQGRVTVGLRYWYLRHTSDSSRELIEQLASRRNDSELMEQVCRHQVLLGDVIQEVGMLSSTLMAQALIDFEPEEESLGASLVRRGLVSEAVIQSALKEQRAEQRAGFEVLMEYA
ncbi:glycosyl transferase family protein [Stutzerimonas frequens]|uniref:glycosyl transferase family protein n=1 Tax=Stutzerimonas frequens TaxID=2968969 RepID=UPI001909DFC6|nr:glycosyl transferase family protein [Stutzerimonas frequens]MBK3874108.1 phage adsorption protein NrfB [Stutzerimonas frequens]MBK3912377.1 phage adsorption protein NrfB [Stutzerimonas frequens]MBK3931659.1 phage adsorption protein NrfB [Stutzerimonas frequens]